MAEQLVLETHHHPTLFNKSMVIGGMLGYLVPIPFVGPAVGAAIGGIIGKKTQERENTQGKAVGEPSFWNKDTFIGGFAGNVIGGIAGTIAFGAIAGTTLTAVAAGAAPITGAVLAGLAVGVAFEAVGTAVGAYVGGNNGKRIQTHEYEQARQQGILKELHQQVSPSVSQAVEYAMENDKTKNWAQHIENERARSQPQETHR